MWSWLLESFILSTAHQLLFKEHLGNLGHMGLLRRILIFSYIFNLQFCFISAVCRHLPSTLWRWLRDQWIVSSHRWVISPTGKVTRAGHSFKILIQWSYHACLYQLVGHYTISPHFLVFAFAPLHAWKLPVWVTFSAPYELQPFQSVDQNSNHQAQWFEPSTGGYLSGWAILWSPQKSAGLSQTHHEETRLFWSHFLGGCHGFPLNITKLY